MYARKFEMFQVLESRRSKSDRSRDGWAAILEDLHAILEDLWCTPVCSISIEAIFSCNLAK